MLFKAIAVEHTEAETQYKLHSTKTKSSSVFKRWQGEVAGENYRSSVFAN